MRINFAAPLAGLAAACTGEFIDDATVRLTPVDAGTAIDVVRQGSRPTTCPASY